MGTFLIAFKTVLPLFLVIIIGMLFSRAKVNHENWIEILNKYALWVGFPALVIYSLIQLDLAEKSYYFLILLNSGYIITCLLLVFPIARIFGLSRNIKRTLFLIFPFGNISYLGIPVLYNAFGEKILPEAAIISAIYLFWLLTLAVLLIEITGHEKTSFKELGINLAQNPLLLSVITGLVIVLLKIELPDFAEKTIKLFSDSVTAVVLFSLGMFLGLQKLSKPKEWLHIALLTIVTMIVLPFLFYKTIQILPFEIDSNGLKAMIIDAAMPLGITPYILAVQYKLKTTLVTRLIVFETLLSMIIIPLWLVWLS